MAFLIDQDTRTAGDYVPFFGRPAFTPTTPAALALRTGAPVIFCWHHRRGKRHQITIERVYFMIRSGNHRRDVLALTAQLTARLETVIRAATRAMGLDAPALAHGSPKIDPGRTQLNQTLVLADRVSHRVVE